MCCRSPQYSCICIAMQPCNMLTLPCSVCQDSCTAQRFQRLVSVLQSAPGPPPAWQSWLDSSSSIASSPASSQQGHTPAAWLQRLASTPLQGSVLAGARSVLPRTAVRGPVLQPRSAPPATASPPGSSRPTAARRLAFDPATTSNAAAPPASKVPAARDAVQGQSVAPRKRKQNPASEDASDTLGTDRVRSGVPVKPVPRSSSGGMQSQQAAPAPRRQDPFSPAASDGSGTSSTGSAADRLAAQPCAALSARLTGGQQPAQAGAAARTPYAHRRQASLQSDATDSSSSQERQRQGGRQQAVRGGVQDRLLQTAGSMSGESASLAGQAMPVHRLRRARRAALSGPSRGQALRGSAAVGPAAGSWRLDSSSSGSSAASSPDPGQDATLVQHRSGLQQQLGRPQGQAPLRRNASGFVLQQQQQVLRDLLGWLERLPQEEQLQQLQSSLPFLHQALSPLKGDFGWGTAMPCSADFRPALFVLCLWQEANKEQPQQVVGPITRRLSPQLKRTALKLALGWPPAFCTSSSSAGSTLPAPDQAALVGLQQEMVLLLSQQQEPQEQLPSGLTSSASFCFR